MAITISASAALVKEMTRIKAENQAQAERVRVLEAALRFIANIPNQPDFKPGASYEADARMAAFKNVAAYAEQALNAKGGVE